MTKKLKPKPCPFCAKEPLVYHWPPYIRPLWSVICKCGAEAPNDSKSESGAIRIWNRRRYINNQKS